MKTIKDSRMYHSTTIIQPLDNGNRPKQWGNGKTKAKRGLDGQTYVQTSFNKRIEIYSNSQLRGMLANEIGNKDKARVMAISTLLKKRLAMPANWKMPKGLS
jgi:hypothetical protein